MKKTIVLDLEFCKVSGGTGCSTVLHNEIIEIGAVAMDENMEMIDKFQTYVRPEFGKVTKKIEILTGISNETLKNERQFEECLVEFLDWIFGADYKEEDSLCCCSWSMSDFYQLETEIKAKNLVSDKSNILFQNWRDIQNEFSSRISYEHPLKLVTAMSALDMEFEGQSHTAFADAKNTAYITSLMEDEESFKKRTKTLRSLFCCEESGQADNTLGVMFGNVFAQLCFT